MAEENEPQEPKVKEDPPQVASEDVPEDFFDDFLKDDFMAGLDIVDEDNDDNTEGKLKKEPNSPSKLKKEPNSTPKVEGQKKSKKLIKHDQELKKLDKELDEMRNKIPKKSDNKHKLDVDNFDIRRDPEKTRQDIQKDKIKSEKKRINAIVDSGLVVPGLELEADMEQVQQQPKMRDLREKLRPKPASVDKVNARKKSPLKRRSKSPKIRSRSRKSRSKPPRSRSRPPKSRSRLSKSRSRPPKSRSRPRITTRSRTRSPLANRNRSPAVTRNRSPAIRNRSPLRISPLTRSRRQRLLSPSPVRRRLRRSRSPSMTRRRSRSLRRSRSSSLTRRNNWRRRRSPSYSPRRKLRRSRSPKPSFLEEIAAKLNYPMPHMPMNNQMYGNLVPIAPMPVPVQPPPPVPHQEVHFFVPPQPQQMHPSQEPYDPYDESFFIGAPAKQAPQQQQQQRGNVEKLFNDKRIQLSDFLASTAKPVLSNAAATKLADKVKVIRRCQDALKELTEPIFNGPLLVRKTDTLKCSTDVTVSPLLRKPMVQLPFVTPGVKNTLADMEFSTCCETLLHRLGLDKRIVHNEPERVKLDSQLQNKSVSPIRAKLIRSKTLTTTGCQTDKELSSCKECLKRKGVLYANVGVQASSGPNMSFSVSTQACDADFYATIPSNQPLSSLTAAQLLGKQAINPMPPARSRAPIPEPPPPRSRVPIPEPPPPPTFYSGFNPLWGNSRDNFHRY